MSNIRFRIAKPSDAKQITDVHWHVRDRYTEGIFLSLGKRFLKTYYRIILNDPWEVVICAVKENGKIVGFSSASQDAKSQVNNLKKHKLELGLAAAFALICHPSLIKGVWQRYKSLCDVPNAPKFIDTEGVRGEYWCWLKGEETGLHNFQVDNIKNRVLYHLGERELIGEVDKRNKGVLDFHKRVNKAEVIDEFTLPDGRDRVVIRIALKAGR